MFKVTSLYQLLLCCSYNNCIFRISTCSYYCEYLRLFSANVAVQSVDHMASAAAERKGSTRQYEVPGIYSSLFVNSYKIRRQCR